MAAQAIFKKCVQHHFPSAFVTNLEKESEFAVGTVLIPRESAWFWQGKHLDFVGIPFHMLLSEHNADLANLKVIRTDVTYSKDSKLRMKLDGDLKAALSDLCVGPFKDRVEISVNFGAKIQRTLGRVYSLIASAAQEGWHGETTQPKSQLRANMGHPIVKEAISKGGVLFVITSTYQAKEVDISVSVAIDNEATGNRKEAAAAGNGTQAQRQRNFQTVDSRARLPPLPTQVIKRDAPTVIAFNIMKVTIDKEGRLTPENKSGYETHHEIYTPYGDVYTLDNLDYRNGLSLPETEDTQRH